MNRSDDIAAALRQLLETGGVRRLYAAGTGLPVPVGANFSVCDRLAVPFSGCHRMTLADGAATRQIHPQRHDATFMPEGSWNQPDWEQQVMVVTFGLRENGPWYSLVDTPGGPLQQSRVARDSFRWTSAEALKALDLFQCTLRRNPGDPRALPLIQVVLWNCVEALEHAVPHHRGKARATYRGICAYLEEAYPEALTRDSVARTFRLTANYLSNLFKAQASLGFNEYLNRLRIERACHLLDAFPMTLDEIALRCGFRHTGYFCRVFRQLKDMTPSEYRHRHAAEPIRGRRK